MKKYLIICSVLFCFCSIAQVNMDSVFTSFDSIPKTENVLKKLEKLSGKKKFRTKELAQVIVWLDNKIKGAADPKDKLTWMRGKGNIYYYQNKYNEALAYYFDLLKLAEEKKDTYFIGIANKDIAETYCVLENQQFGIKHFYFALVALQKLDEPEELSSVYNALGTAYKDQKKYDSSLKYHERSLEIKTKLGNKLGMSYSFNNMAIAYRRMKNFEKAELYLNKSLEIKRELKDKKGIAGSLINLGNVYMELKKNKEALVHFEEGTQLALEMKAGEFYKNGIEGLAQINYQVGEYKEAAKWYKKYKRVSDSLKQDATNKQITELTAQYESEKKDTEITLQQEQLKSQLAENTKQRILIVASGIALIMALIAIIVVYRSYRQNKKNAVVLAAKNHLIEEKNKEITDSINYAMLIQQSLLASKEMLDKNLDSYFILYKPKDIVSGDFYWASETPKGFLIACVDCTGHGVPGAFMSLIGKENLDKALAKTVNPGEILHELNINVKRSLNQGEGSGNKDGMDAAVLRIEKDSTGAKVTYAGANRPLYLIKKDAELVEEIKATKQAVGGFTKNEQVFDEHVIHVNKGDTLVITTDGYADQFGVDGNKKLTTKRFKELLVSVKTKQAEEQKQTLNDFFSTWKGNIEQLDDLLVIGINI